MGRKGKFIVIDGPNGSGKGTQTSIIVKLLQKKGYSVEMMDFPQYGNKSAGLVEEYLNGKYGETTQVGPYKASIFYACDRYDASFKIRQMLQKGEIVVSNRYTASSMAHQAGQIKDLKERNKFLKWLHDLEFGLFEIPEPDLNIILYNDPITTQEWVDKKGKREYIQNSNRDMHEKDLQHLKDAARGYKYIARKYKYPLIEAKQSIEKVTEEIMTYIKPLLD